MSYNAEKVFRTVHKHLVRRNVSSHVGNFHLRVFSVFGRLKYQFVSLVYNSFQRNRFAVQRDFSDSSASAL